MVKLRANAYTGYRTRTNLATPQTQPIPGREADMKANNAGGFSFAMDPWKVLDRFLVLGSEGGTYYVGEKELTLKNAKNVQALIAQDGPRVVHRVVELSEQGRTPKADPALFVLALAIAQGDKATKRLVIEQLPRVARIGTHLFTFVQYATQFRGWGRALREAVSNWYTSMEPSRLAYQAVKYQQRNGWSHRDLLRLSHAKATSAYTMDDPLGQLNPRNQIFNWMVKGWDSVGMEPHPEQALRQIWAFERAKKANNAAELMQLITEFDLPRECIPTEYLKDKDVWAALLNRMPLTAMIRNLATMSRVGLLVPNSPAAQKIYAELGNAERIKAARVHPLQVLSALRVYSGGTGYRSRAADFEPLPQITAALENAFYLSFGNVEPTGKRTLLALDVSGSMTGGEIGGVPGLTPMEASAAMAMVTARAEWGTDGYPLYHSVAFSTNLIPFSLAPDDTLRGITERMNQVPFGGTDCSLPIKYALDKGIQVDAFITYTDSETWAGRSGHPAELIQKYRKESGIPARMVVVGLTATDISIADPNDAGMLDVVGFDSAAPGLISSFVKGEL